MLSSSVEARLEWAVSAGRPSFSSENETPFVRLARSQLLQCDDRQMCKATKETQKITLCITKDARGESGGRTSVARSDATQMIKNKLWNSIPDQQPPNPCRHAEKNASSFTVAKKYSKMCVTLF